MPVDHSAHTGADTVRLFVSLGIMTVGVAATLATILGFFGSVWWAFDLLAGYRLQLAVILALVAAAFRVGFGIATSILFFAAAVTNVVIVSPLFLGSRAEAAGDAAILTVASVPVEESGKSEAMEWVEQSRVDIAFLVDTDDTWEGVAAPPGYVIAGQAFIGRQTGTTVVARSGIEVDVTPIDNTSSPAVRAETTMGDRDVVLYALLLPAPGSDTEARQRNDLLERIADRINAETAPVAVIGDLGLSHWSHSFRVLAGNASLEDSSPGNGFQGATPGGLWIGLRVPTHHLLHSSSLAVTGRHLGPDLGHGRAVLVGTLAPAAG